LDRTDPVSAQPLEGLERARQRPGAVRVNPDLGVRAHDRADLADQRRVLLDAEPDLDLDRAEAKLADHRGQPAPVAHVGAADDERVRARWGALATEEGRERAMERLGGVAADRV